MEKKMHGVVHPVSNQTAAATASFYSTAQDGIRNLSTSNRNYLLDLAQQKKKKKKKLKLTSGSNYIFSCNFKCSYIYAVIISLNLSISV